jgi:hypothetical protein
MEPNATLQLALAFSPFLIGVAILFIYLFWKR